MRAWKPVVATLWIVTAIVALTVTIEIAFQLRSRYKEAHDVRRYSVLAKSYAPFMSESLHPQYVFFFPLAERERLAIGNAVCSIDAHGFREPGIDRANGRKLAFLVGGSVAFGLFASSNDTTITSHLNRLQQEYFFVNAGVPGFTSTQELVRLTFELADQKPALVVVLDGWNDLTLAREPAWIEQKIPAGTPEAFPALQHIVKASQSPWRHLLPEVWFPEISLRLRSRVPDAGPPPVPVDRLSDAATRYTTNHERMAAIAQSVGARFVSVFQPLAALHQNIAADVKDKDAAAEMFHQLVRERLPASVEAHDMGRIFDSHFPTIPVGVPEINDETVFVDNGHLYDRGNAIVAAELLKRLR